MGVAEREEEEEDEEETAVPRVYQQVHEGQKWQGLGLRVRWGVDAVLVPLLTKLTSLGCDTGRLRQDDAM